jgi:RNA polymerase sigma-70 factor (ECF subfamily)
MSNKPNTLNPEKWSNLYADYLFQYTNSRIGDYETAKDLVQETFLSALKAMANFRGDANERTWLTSILKRKIIDHYRKRNSNKGKAEVHMSFYDDGNNKGSWIEERVPQEWGNEAEKSIENEELKSVINLCIDFLPEKYAMIFRMRTIHNIETDEVCKELDITSSNLWVMIHRARTQLRKCLEDNWFNK